MKFAYEEWCILELARKIRAKGVQSQEEAVIQAKKQFQEFDALIESMTYDAQLNDRYYFYISDYTPEPMLMMLKRMGYKLSVPHYEWTSIGEYKIKVDFSFVTRDLIGGDSE